MNLLSNLLLLLSLCLGALFVHGETTNRRSITFSVPHELDGLFNPKPLDEEEKIEIIKERRTERKEDAPLVPVLIIPSLIGNQLEAELVNATTHHFYCSSNSDWYNVWLDTTNFYPFKRDCWTDNMKLGFDTDTLRSVPLKGVNIRPVDYGGLGGVTYLDVQKSIISWGSITDILVALGYTAGKNLRAAPYDWRYGPDTEFANSFQPLKMFIEDMYLQNGNLSISVTSNSMGGGYFLLFLEGMTQEWKDQYIHSFVPFSSCFGGSIMSPVVLSLKLVYEDIPFSDIAATWPSVLWLSPYLAVDGDRLLFTTPTKKFTITTLTDYLNYAGLNVSSLILQSVLANQTLNPPRVPTYCIFGMDVPTVDQVHFETESLFGGPSTNTTVPGDGTCRAESLDLCSVWASQQTQPSVGYGISKLQHGTLNNGDSIRYFLKILGL